MSIYSANCITYWADWDLPFRVGQVVSMETIQNLIGLATVLAKPRWTHTVQYLAAWSFTSASIFYPLPLFAGYSTRLLVQGSWAQNSSNWTTAITKIGTTGAFTKDSAATASAYTPFLDPAPPVNKQAQSASQYTSNTGAPPLICGYSIESLTATSPGGFTFRAASGAYASNCYCTRPDGTVGTFPIYGGSIYYLGAYFLRALDDCRKTSEQMPVVLCCLPYVAGGTVTWNGSSKTTYTKSEIGIALNRWIPLHQTMAKRALWVVAYCTGSPNCVGKIHVGGQEILLLGSNYTTKHGNWYRWIVDLTMDAYNDAVMDYGVAGLVPVLYEGGDVSSVNCFACWIAGAIHE